MSSEQRLEQGPPASAAAAAPSERTPLLSNGSGAAPGGPEPSQSHHELSRRQLIAALGSLYLVLFFSALDGTVASTLLAPISSSFNAAEKASWLGTAFLLAVCAFTPLYGRLSDVFGRSNAMVTALFFFTLGTAGCAYAPSMNFMLAARAVAGAGAGGILTCVSIINSDIVSLRQRGLFQGIGNITFATGGALGGLYGGVMNDRFGWRSAFTVQVPFLVFGAFLITRTIRIPQKPILDTRGVPLTTWQKIARIDWLGSALLVSGVGSLLVLLTILSTDATAGLSDRRVVSSAILLIVSVLAFFCVEAYVVAEPILPLSLLRQRSPGCIAATYFVSSCAYYSLFFYYPLYLQAVRGYAPSQAGLRTMPIAIFTMSGSLGTGIIIKLTGRYYWLQTVGGFLPVVSMGFLMFWTPEWPGKLAEFISLCPAGLGLSSVYTTLVVAMMAAVTRSEIATANGLIYLSRTLGQVIGVGSAGAIMQKILHDKLTDRVTGPGSASTIANIEHSIDYIRTLPAETQAAARLSYSDSLRVVFIVVTVLQFLAWLCSLPIEENSVDAPLLKPTSPVEADEAE